MSSWMWKIRQFVSNLVPIALFCALIYGGWSLYQQGAFRRGLKPAIVTALTKVPYFGSRFRHYAVDKKSVANSGKKHFKKQKQSRRGGHKRRPRR